MEPLVSVETQTSSNLKRGQGRAMNNALLKFINQNINVYKRQNYPRSELIKYFQSVCPEFAQLSEMSISMLLHAASLIKLNNSESYNIPDHTQIGVYFVLKGACELVFAIK